MSKVPNPGSREARERGCCCAVMDNHYGAGIVKGPGEKPVFWITLPCELHGRAQETRGQDDK